MKTDLLQKMNDLKVKISEQKSISCSSIYTLKEEERHSVKNYKCKEKEYCRINHQKYTYIKSKSDELFSQLMRFTDVDKISTVEIVSGARRKCFTCNMCEKKFPKQGQLKRHRKSEHREKKVNGGSVTIESNRRSVIV